MKYFKIYVWFYLILNIVVILDGALVRATGSGAGCGAHWPLCQGNLFPNLVFLNTFIEFTHRVGSGIVGVGAVILLIGAFVSYPRKHPVRFLSIVVVCLVILEALLGAGLVLFGLVENNASIARIWVMGFHLATTFLLLGAITLAAGWSSGLCPTLSRTQQTAFRTRSIQFCLLLLLLTGITGGITALGDTLFKPEYVGQNLLQEFSSSAHVLQMLRAFHPIFALFTSFVLAFIIIKIGFQAKQTKILGITILIIIFMQIFVGVMNLAFLTPVGLQLLHLFLADVLWITTILYSAVLLYRFVHFEFIGRIGCRANHKFIDNHK